MNKPKREKGRREKSCPGRLRLALRVARLDAIIDRLLGDFAVEHLFFFHIIPVGEATATVGLSYWSNDKSQKGSCHVSANHRWLTSFDIPSLKRHNVEDVLRY